MLIPETNREKKLMYKNFEIEVLFIELQELLRFRSKLDGTRWRENDTCATVWREDVTKIMLSHSLHLVENLQLNG